VPHQLQWSSSGQPIAAYGVSRPLRVYGGRMKTHGHCVNICTRLNPARNQVVFRILKHSCCESTHANFLTFAASLATAAAPPPQGYDYGSGPYGPDLWGELKPEWELCKTGISQSPLAITPDIMITDPTLGELDIFYTPNAVNATISNTGHAIEV